jgi:hypothetical protein
MRTFADIVSTLKLETTSAEDIHLTYEMVASPDQYEHVTQEDKITLLQLMVSYSQETDCEEKKLISSAFENLLNEKFR